MSFDSEFDYTGSISFIDEKTDTLNVTVSSITTKLADLANVDPAFNYITGPELTTLTNNKNIYDTMISKYQDLKGEIAIVTGLPSGDKANLYSFYSSSVNEPKTQWMGRMVYNTEGLLQEAGNVIAGNLTSNQSNLVAELICGKFPIKGIVYQVQSKFE